MRQLLLRSNGLSKTHDDQMTSKCTIVHRIYASPTSDPKGNTMNHADVILGFSNRRNHPRSRRDSFLNAPCTMAAGSPIRSSQVPMSTAGMIPIHHLGVKG